MKKILLSGLLLAALACASCSKDGDTIIGFQVPQDVKKDFASRFATASQTGQTTWDRDGNKVYIDFLDAAGHSGTAVYTNHQWSRTLRALTSERDLPSGVLKAFLRSEYVESLVNGFDSIVEVDQALMAHKVYLLSFRTGEEETDPVRTMAISDDGLVLHIFPALVDDQKDAEPAAADVSWMGVNYRAGVIEGFLRQGGHNYYYLLHNGVVKQVDFCSGTHGNVWVETSYTLPEGADVPERVLTVLRSYDENFEYDEVEVIETAKGTSYVFVDSHRTDCEVTYRVNDY